MFQKSVGLNTSKGFSSNRKQQSTNKSSSKSGFKSTSSVHKPEVTCFKCIKKTEEIKKLQTKNKTKEEKIEALEKEVKRLKKRVRYIKEDMELAVNDAREKDALNLKYQKLFVEKEEERARKYYILHCFVFTAFPLIFWEKKDSQNTVKFSFCF